MTTKSRPLAFDDLYVLGPREHETVALGVSYVFLFVCI
jgi:hypothetical protein